MPAFGIYEKALPKNISWLERLSLAKSLNFDFVEMSIDETDERIERLSWDADKIEEVKSAIAKTGVTINSICLSVHRRYPFGSKDPVIRQKALEVMQQGVDLASKLGVRNIQLAGYDVYYEEKTEESRKYFIENLKQAVKMAAKKQVMLSIEIMDDPFINSISKYLEIKKEIKSPWLQVYPDLGNLSAWPENNPYKELEIGINEIVAVHVKDTLRVTEDYPGKFKNVPFGEGHVDFVGLLKTLKSLDYDGCFLIEMWSEVDEHPLDRISEAKEYLKPKFEEAGYDYF